MKPKKLSTAFITALLTLTASSISQGALIISGLGDPDGGSGDILELYATTAIPDLTLYSIATANNSDSLSGPGTTLAAGSLAAGAFYYITTDFVDFAAFVGFSADEDLNININGNDTVGLYLSGTLTDRVLADADATDIHGDGWIYRNTGNGPNTTYTPSEWTITRDSLGSSTTSTNAASATPMPIGTYAIPEPSTALLSAFGVLALLRRRRSSN